ncbi:RagB/SusD family nutrient uptake outer membrane protein, partial [Bacteroides heparinolyticus]
TGEESQIDWIVYRYADVLTLLSEAIVRQNDVVTQEAIDLLNMVHERAGLKGYKMTDFSDVDTFLNTVLEERGHELWFEGVRRSDLIRYGKYIEYARKYKNSVTAQEYMNLMPLPQAIIDESKGAIANNPEY